MGKLLRSQGVLMRRNVWMPSWSLSESMGSVPRGNSGGFSMLWVAFVMLPECFSPLTKRTNAVFFRMRRFWGGWIGMGFWKRARTSSIMRRLSPWKTFSSAASRLLFSRLVWLSPSTMPECSSNRGTLGK